MRVKNPFRTASRILFHKVPIDSQLIITRRCNLTCGYCSEYDTHSPEVPFEELKQRIDALHRLGAINITLLGGEPLLHSRVGDIIRYAGKHAQVSMTTNAFLLSDSTIGELNDAGLSNMQVSIDTLQPDPSRYIQKTLKSLLPKLERLDRLAQFDVLCQVVLCEESKGDFVELLKELERFDFHVSVNLLHDDRGEVQIGGEDYRALWNRHFNQGNPVSFIEQDYGNRLLAGQRPAWRCRAGARYIYVDEFGKAQFCSAQRGRLNKDIRTYTVDDLREHAETEKGCESGCVVFCAYRASQIDNAFFSTVGAVVKGVRRGGFKLSTSAEGAPK